MDTGTKTREIGRSEDEGEKRLRRAWRSEGGRGENKGGMRDNRREGERGDGEARKRE